MEKFTEVNTKIDQFGDKVQNDLYDIIKNTLTPTINGDVSEKLNLLGVKELTSEIYKIVEKESIKNKINILKNLTKTNTINEFNDKDITPCGDQLKILKIIDSCVTQDQLDTASNMMDLYLKKYPSEEYHTALDYYLHMVKSLEDKKEEILSNEIKNQEIKDQEAIRDQEIREKEIKDQEDKEKHKLDSELGHS